MIRTITVGDDAYIVPPVSTSFCSKTTFQDAGG